MTEQLGVSITQCPIYPDTKANSINWTIIDPPEKSRIYVFPHHRLRIENACKIEIRSSGKHRIETTDGKKYFVNTGWDFIDIDVDTWTT